MTEVILSASVSSTVKMILWNLSSLIFQEFALREGVSISELEMLYSTLSLIQTVIHDAEERQSHEEAVKDWLKSLGDAACDADDVLDELLVRALRWKEDKGMMKKVRQFSSPSKLVFRFKIGHKIKEVMRRLDVIAKYTENFNFKMYVVSPRRRVERTPTDSYILIDSKVYGREEDRDKIVKMLTSSDDKDEISVIPIVGMGGLGKTTIAQLAYRDDRVARCFNLQMWVCVSDDLM
uniref:Disease resistance protein RGA3 n=1 Tax=Nelumbo nucifera TaxID=4432 RepID=A0A822YAH8_NELNU|nr:TPA_asm: hypothetical protein HUJ06_031048 [Nelumbo nucifera]